MFLGSALWVMAAAPEHRLEYSPLPDGPLAHETHLGLLWQSLLLSVPCFAAYVWALAAFFPKHPKLKQELEALIICSLYGIFGGSVLLSLGLNVLLDRDPGAEHRVRVIDKYNSTALQYKAAPSRAYRLTLQSWRPNEPLKVLGVKSAEFQAAVPKKSAVTVKIRPGFFGHPWIEHYRINEMGEQRNGR